VNSKKLAGARAAAIGAATVASLILGATAAHADDEPKHDQAYGVAASGLLNVNEIPFVESKDGKHVEKETTGFGEGPLSIGKLVVQAEDHRAQSDVKDVKLANLLKIAAVRTICDDDDTSTEIVDGYLLGTKLPAKPFSNQKIVDLGGLLRVTLGKETRNDNDSITVEGVVVELLGAPSSDKADEKLTEAEKDALPLIGNVLGKDLGGVDTLGSLSSKLGVLGGDKAKQKVVITSATCFPKGGGDGDDGDDNGGGKDKKSSDKKSKKDADKGKKSKAVKANLPVTG
jgi:hypothetical protein